MSRVRCSGTIFAAFLLSSLAQGADLVVPTRSKAEPQATGGDAASAANIEAFDLIGNAGSALTKVIVSQKSPQVPQDALLRLIEGAQVRVTVTALNQIVRKEVDEHLNVNDVLLGVPLSGRARLQGATSLKLAADPARGVFDIFFTGSAVSQTLGDADKAHIHSRTVTRFAARKRVILDERGLTALPATCNATAKSTIVGTTSPLPGLRGRLASRIGWRQAQRQLAEADRISAQHSAAQICRRFDAEVATQLAEANQLLAQQAAEWAKRSGGQLTLRFSTTDDHLCVSGPKAESHLAGPTGLAAGVQQQPAAVIVIPAGAVDFSTAASFIGTIAGASGGGSVSAMAQQVLPADVASLIDEQQRLGNIDYGVRFAIDQGRLVLAVHPRED